MEGLWNVGPGDEIPLLYSLIRDNPKFLQDFEELQFADTPLHVTASKGLSQVALEIIRLMPSLGRKLNPDGFTPLDLAMQCQHGDTVRAMTNADPELISVPGREGITPLHWAADRGDADMVAEFLLQCPDSIDKLTIRRETAVHVAVKYGNMQAFEVLLGWLQRSGRIDMLYLGDWEGNTPLHVAAYTNQSQIVEVLVKKEAALVKCRNFKGLTALGIAMNHPLPRDRDNARIATILQSKSKHQKPDISRLYNIQKVSDYLRSPMNRADRVIRRRIQLRKKLSSDSRNAIIVMAVLIITVTYQGAVNPPPPCNTPKDNSVGFVVGNTTSIAEAPPYIKYDEINPEIELMCMLFQLFNWLGFGSSVAMLVVALPYFVGVLKLSLLCTFSFLFGSYIITVLVGFDFSLIGMVSVLTLCSVFSILFNVVVLMRMRRTWSWGHGWVSSPLMDIHGHFIYHKGLVLQSVFEMKMLATTSLKKPMVN